MVPKVDGDGSIFAFSLLNTSVFPDSISYVIMSDCSASFRIAISSLKSPTICFAPDCEAGQFSVGSSTVISDISSVKFWAASVIIIPS